MKPKSRRFPSLEQLEDRWAPATVRFISGTLYISNPTVVSGTSNVTVTQMAANTFKVMDGASSNGTFAGVSNITYSGSNAADRFTVNLNGLTYTGSLLANAGNGNDSVLVGNGNMRGNLQVLPGYGNDSVDLGGSLGGLTVGGTTQVNDSAGNDSITFGNGSTASNFQGTVSMTGMNVIRLANGAADTFGGDLTASTITESVPLDFETSATATAVTVNGNLQLTGGSNDDTVVDSALVVNKSVNINLGGSLTSLGNFVSEQIGSPPLQVSGSFTYTGGSGFDEPILSGNSVGGTMSLTLGDGDDLVDLATAGGIEPNPTIGGDLTISGGNGNINFNGIAGEGITATVAGNMNFNLGSGNDSATIVNAPVVLNWTSSNGNDSVTLGGATTAAGSTWNVNFHFGTGSDTLALSAAAPATQFLTGFVDMGGPTGGNSFDPTGQLGVNWQTVPPFTLQNV